MILQLIAKSICSLDNVVNPLTGKREERVLVKFVLLKQHEVSICIKQHYQKMKGAGARKIYKSLCKSFTGVSEREVQSFLNQSRKNQHLNPKFKNKPRLTPVKSSAVFNQVKVDLVSMEDSPISVGFKTYKYILVVLDIFSRFVFLRVLQSKHSAEVASELLQIFTDAGPPHRLQSDQGNEFKGVVKELMAAMKVNIIYSRPYHPQSQGKVSLVQLHKRVVCGIDFMFILFILLR